MRRQLAVEYRHMQRHARAFLASIATSILLVGAALGADKPEQGVWLKHEYQFTYMGFTSHYSCDGLADKLTLLLKAAGARADVKADGFGCDRPIGPSRISSAHLTFYTLAPPSAVPPPKPAPPAAPARQLGKDAPKLRVGEPPPEPGVGAWKTLKIRAGQPYFVDPGDCELVEQFNHDLLPMFTTRNVVSHMTCVPNQLSPGQIQLDFDVLAPLPPAEKAQPKPVR
jgi:hypothetical protein